MLIKTTALFSKFRGSLYAGRQFNWIEDLSAQANKFVLRSSKQMLGMNFCFSFQNIYMQVQNKNTYLQQKKINNLSVTSGPIKRIHRYGPTFQQQLQELRGMFRSSISEIYF